MISWLLATALASECGELPFDDAPQTQSVAWISPSSKTVGRNGEVMVVPTADLRRWAADHADGSVARMLQMLGLRGKARDPKRPWKVVIFDAERADLCRPVAGYDDPVAIAGLVSCRPGPSKANAGQTGCGTTLNRATGEAGLEQVRGSWSDLARNGFCVLPAERFLESLTGQK